MPSLKTHYDRVIQTKAQEENQLGKLHLRMVGLS